MDSVDPKAKVTVIPAEPVLSTKAKHDKLELDFKNSSICGHVMKNITNISNPKRTKLEKQPTPTPKVADEKK